MMIFNNKGIPTLLTLCGFCFSVSAIIEASHGEYIFSLGLALYAFTLDLLDGFVARFLEAESDLGRILDSIADVPLYLIYPAVIVAALYQSPFLFLGAFVFVVCGIFRLVRFTRRGFITSDGHSAYEGLPVFVSLPLIGGLVVSNAFHMLPSSSFVLTVYLVLGILMVSTLPIRKLKNRRIISVLAAACVGTATTLVLCTV